MNPLNLNQQDPDGILIYGLDVDALSDTAILTLGVDAESHQSICESFSLEASDTVLLDFVFTGVRSACLEGMLDKPSGVAEDEPPHNYEIAAWKVKKLSFGGKRYRLEVRCYNAPRCSIVFDDFSVVKSPRPPGVVHDYEAEAAAKSTIQA